MPTVAFVVPGRLEQRTGGSLYNRRMVEGLRARGWTVAVHELHDSFPTPDAAAFRHAATVLGALAPGTVTVIDGLACGAMPAVVAQAAARLPLVALMHLPLAADIGLTPLQVAHFESSEQHALQAVALTIVTGPATTALMTTHRLVPTRTIVVEPGTDCAPLARGCRGAGIRLLSVATLNPGKGHAVLLEALAAVPHRKWQLHCAGSLTRHPETADAVRRLATRLGLGAQVSLLGELDEAALNDAYDGADLFVLATQRETYGMAVAEALARGLPVVSTATGAISALVGRDAGIVVPPGDTAALATALTAAITDDALRARMAAGARVVRGRLSGWDQASAAFAAALQTVDHHG